MDEKPSYFAIIPANVRYAKINPSAKLLYGEITALANVKGYCYASNDYFADLYDLKRKQTVSDWIRSLEDLGVITVERLRDEKKIKKRKIYLSNNLQRKNVVAPTTKNSYTVQRKNVAGYNEKTLREYYKNNNTSNNNSSSETSENPYELYQQITGRNLTGTQQPKMMDFIKTDGAELVISALKTAQYIANQSDNKANYGLFDSVMHEWEDQGIKTVDQAREYEKQRLRDKQERINKSKQAFRGYPTIDRKMPESMKEKYDPEKDKLSEKDKASLEKELEEFYERGKEEQE